MGPFEFYTGKIDELHIVNKEDLNGRTICGHDMTSANYFENDRFMNIDASRKERRHVCLSCLSAMMIQVNGTIHNLQLEINARTDMNENLEKKCTELMSEEEMRKKHPLVTVMAGAKSMEISGPIVEKPLEIPGRPVRPPEQRNKDAIYISSGRAGGGKTKELIDKVIKEVRHVFESGDQNFFVMEILGYDKATVIQNTFNEEGFDTFIVQDFHQQVWNLIIAEKRNTLTKSEDEYRQLTEEGPFIDGQTLEDIPKCAIPDCTNEDVRYWIHPEGKPIKYFCGDCPQSQIEILDKFAKSIGEEVVTYNAPIWAVEMLFKPPDDDIRTWLIQAHNMAEAIQRAREGDYDTEIMGDPGFAQGDFVPVDIRESDEDEQKEFNKNCN